ncbi:MAG: NYN domain-containing protein [Chloroflexales bacterium]|nr:NYN domain-containing protein [Chloroflexales bacterium]
MPVLVDGHNLIGQIPSLSLDAPDDEAQLVLLLRRYATRKRGRRVVVVFDHGVYGHPQSLNGYGVECVFAKSPRDADAEIARRVRAVKRPKDWLVVSSDRAVAGEARARGIPVVSSQEFGSKLLLAGTPNPTVYEKGVERALTPKEIEEWLRLFGVEEGEEES